MLTIIGAKAFHGPVRDGKAWDHLAMVVRRNGDQGLGRRLPVVQPLTQWVKSVALTVGRRLGIVVTELLFGTFSRSLKIIGSSLTGN